ncbi:STM3941 family protein [Paenibacillus sp. JSM ZJ436]|uniref:STM3941 family protein n=1 Tax=Paenibacillus sp. JSM ZJ436 TaxID=3376190 RepID=UPI00379780FB
MESSFHSSSSTSSTEDIVIYGKPGKLFIISLGFVLIGILMMVIGQSEEADAFILIAVGIVSTLVFGLCMLYFLMRLIKPRPALVIDLEGLTDHSSYVNGGRIRWEEIEDIVLYSYMNQHMIGIQLKDAEGYVSSHKGLKRLLIRMNKNMASADVSIMKQSVSENLEKVYLILLKHWKQSQGNAVKEGS